MKEQEVSISFVVGDDFISHMKKQKQIILATQEADVLPKELNEELDGLLNFIDYIQDQLVDVYGISETDVFDLDERTSAYGQIESEIKNHLNLSLNK